jgi:STE24 endopeptidase
MAQLDAERQRQAAEYAKKRRRFGAINLIFSVAFILVLVMTDLSKTVAGWLPATPVLAAAIYLALLMLVYDILTLPLSYQTGLNLPRHYGLSRQAFSGWLADHVKSLSMGIAFGAISVAILYFLIERSTDLWWLFAWGLLMVVSLVLTVLAPLLLVPLFFKMRPLEEGGLVDRLTKLAAKAGVSVGGIYVIEFSEKTSLANAGVMGLGHTKRVVISDTMIERYSTEEIEVVMAHELAHQRHGDVWRLYGVQAATLLVVFGLASWLFGILAEMQVYVNLFDPAALPLLLFCFSVAGAPGLPLLSWFSRRLEAAADAYALELTNKPGVFISAMTKLTDQNLGEARPSSFLDRLSQDHPSYNDRVKRATEYAEKNQLDIANDEARQN